MAVADKSAEEREAKDIERGIGGLPVGHPQASYFPPDLSLDKAVGVGEMAEEEEAWHEQRDSAREDAVKAGVESEKKEVELQREAAEEASDEAQKSRDAFIDTQVKLGLASRPTKTADEVAAEKRAGSGSKSKAASSTS